MVLVWMLVLVLVPLLVLVLCAVSWFLGPGSWVPLGFLILALALALALILKLVLVLALVPSSGAGCWVLGSGFWVMAFIFAFPKGMVLNYHIGLMISRNLSFWQTFAKLLCR